jgi:hypothetical protein
MSLARIYFGDIDILEMDSDENSSDLLGDDSMRSLTMSVDDFERRRLMRSQSEVEFSFFMDRMASTVSPQSSQQLSPPQRRQSEDDLVEAMILNNYMEQDTLRSNNHAQPPKLPQRRRSLEVSKIIAKKSSADEAPSVRHHP